MAIESDISEEVEVESVIDDFASRHVKRSIIFLSDLFVNFLYIF